MKDPVRRVTGIDIVDHVGDALLRPPITKHSLLAAAMLNQAPANVLAVLEALPDAVFRDARESGAHCLLFRSAIG